MLRRTLAFARRRPRTVAVSVRTAGGGPRVAASSELEPAAVGALPCRTAAARASPASGPETPGPGERLANRELRSLPRRRLADWPGQRGADQRPMDGAFELVDAIGLRFRSSHDGSVGPARDRW